MDEEKDEIPKLFSMPREERATYLAKVFAEFDYDESGTIEHNELYAAMEYMGIQVSRKVCDVLIEDMDVDRSGTVDLEEFAGFFDRIQSFNNMKEVLAKKGAMGKIKDYVLSGYLLAMLAFTFFVLYGYINSGTTEERTQEHFFLVLLTVGLFIASFVYVVALPLLQLTVRKWVAPPIPAEWSNDKNRQRVMAETGLSADGSPVVDIVEDLAVEEVAEQPISWRKHKQAFPAITDEQNMPIAWDVPGAIPDKSRSDFGTSARSMPALEDTSQQMSATKGSLQVSLAETTPVMAFDEEEAYNDYERPYHYDRKVVGSEVLRPHFNPWTLKKARVY